MRWILLSGDYLHFEELKVSWLAVTQYVVQTINIIFEDLCSQHLSWLLLILAYFRAPRFLSTLMAWCCLKSTYHHTSLLASNCWNHSRVAVNSAATACRFSTLKTPLATWYWVVDLNAWWAGSGYNVSRSLL